MPERTVSRLVPPSGSSASAAGYGGRVEAGRGFEQVLRAPGAEDGAKVTVAHGGSVHEYSTTVACRKLQCMRMVRTG